jgi:hypothetical protein
MPKINIETITPANSDGNELKNYYFLSAGNGTYSFYDKHNNLIQSGLAGGLHVNFRVNSLNFTIWIMSLSDTGASGDWQALNSEAVPPGSGTFQAQAVGTGDPEPESSYEATA